MPEPCPSHLLTDESSGADAFGSHDRVAGGIANLIASERGGRAIAVVGPLGAGKSTVIRLLRTQLGKSDKATRFFVFDAWAHAADPLRRAFLEELLSSLRAEWITSERADEIERKLRLRIDKTSGSSKPKLTTYAKFLAFAALGIPFAAAYAREWDRYVPLFGLQVPLWVLALWLGVMNPLIAIALAWLFGSKEERQSFTLFTQSMETTSESTSVRSVETTSVEFSRLFGEIVSSAIDDKRRLIIVLDNLDRLPVDDARPIWSTMRTFVDEMRSSRFEGARNGVWFVVPFAEEVVSPQLVTGTAIAKEQPQTEQWSASLAKTFDAVFRVSPPVLPRGRAFFQDQLAKAFPKHEDPREREQVYAIYQAQTWTLGSPREIKAFINELVVLHHQWGDVIRLPELALFVGVRRDIRTDGSNLLDNFLPTEVERVVDFDWRKNLAALHFNVPLEEALYVLQAPAIMKALTTGSTEELAALQPIPGFEDALFQTVYREHGVWGQSNAEQVLLAAAAVYDLGDEALHKKIGRYLAYSAKNIKEMPLAGERTWTGAVALVAGAPRAEDRKELAEKIVNAVSATPTNDEGDRHRWAERYASTIPDLRNLMGVDFPALPLADDREQQIAAVQCVAAYQAGLTDEIWSRCQPERFMGTFYDFCERGTLLQHGRAFEEWLRRTFDKEHDVDFVRSIGSLAQKTLEVALKDETRRDLPGRVGHLALALVAFRNAGSAVADKELRRFALSANFAVACAIARDEYWSDFRDALDIWKRAAGAHFEVAGASDPRRVSEILRVFPAANPNWQ